MQTILYFKIMLTVPEVSLVVVNGYDLPTHEATSDGYVVVAPQDIANIGYKDSHRPLFISLSEQLGGDLVRQI